MYDRAFNFNVGLESLGFWMRRRINDTVPGLRAYNALQLFYYKWENEHE